MKRRARPWFAILGLASALAGCDYSSNAPPPVIKYDPNAGTSAGTDATGAVTSLAAAPDSERHKTILESVIHLIQTATLKPGGENFRQATDKLNNLFEGTPPAEYLLKPEARALLLKQMPETALNRFERTSWELRDARHLEDCMLYYSIATRIAGPGDDLTRVRRVFDWMVSQVQLVPPNSLAVPRSGQAQARPYDVLLRGMATEAGGYWSERGWLFMSLCRQLGIDVGLLTYTPPKEKDAVPWICAAAIDGRLYLFDPRLGLAVPGPDGTGVATLDQALADPVVLGRLDLPGQAPYGTTRADLAGSKSKIGVLLDSSPGYLSPRMLLLQNSLAGKNRTVLYRDLAEQHDQFVKALGANAGKVELWGLPMTVETMLFNNAEFVEATQHTLYLFGPQFPLIYARIKHLRGEIPEAIAEYINLRFAENAMQRNGKIKITADEQRALDMYSTYFLGLCHRERNNPKQAEFFFGEVLRLLPAPGPRQPFYHMFRWGAETNLAQLHEARGDLTAAIGYYSEAQPTPQQFGNLFRARELVWRNPTSPPPLPLPPPPAPEVGAALAPPEALAGRD